MRSVTRGPKCLIRINRQTLIGRIISLLNGSGIKDITVVVGYQAEEVVSALEKCRLKARIIENRDFGRGSILSLWAARDKLKGDLLLVDADLYFEKKVIQLIIRSRKKDFFLIDTASGKDEEAVRVGFRNNRAVKLARGLKGNYPVIGEWAGFLRLSGSAAIELKELLSKLIDAGERKLGYEFIIPGLFKKAAISYELTSGLKWTELDYPKDIKKAKRLLRA